MEGTHGYFDPTLGSQDNTEIINTINNFQPDILMVGMGKPKQEYWILNNINSVNAKVFLTCGGSIDRFAEALPTPPAWMIKIGLSGVYRMLIEPRRLWKRYLIEPWFVFLLFLKEIWKTKFGSSYNTN